MSTACDIVFGIFILAWFVARHVLYMVHFWSTSRSIGTLKTYGCYSSVTGERLSYDGGSELLSNILQPFYWPDGPVCFNQRVFVTLWGLLLVLQLLMIIWFVMIVRVAYRVLSGQGAEDTRSDDEDEIEESVEKAVPSHTCAEMSPKLQLPLIEQEVGAEAMHKPRKSNSGRNNCRKPNNRSTGLSIPGHSDRKDLLGRIGCDKPT